VNIVHVSLHTPRNFTMTHHLLSRGKLSYVLTFCHLEKTEKQNCWSLIALNLKGYMRCAYPLQTSICPELSMDKNSPYSLQIHESWKRN